MLWLSFFGHMKLGETALYMTLSYAVGSLLFVCIMGIGDEAARICAIVLPFLSGITFLYSNKLYEHEAGSSSTTFLSEMRTNGNREAPIFPYITRMTAFATGSAGTSPGPTSKPLAASASALPLL